MLHSIAGVIVGGKVYQEGIRIEFRRPPHRCLGADNLFNVSHQSRPLTAFIAERVDHHVVLLSLHLKLFSGPVGSNLSGRVDHDVPIWKTPLTLIGLFHPAIDNSPPGWRI